MRAKDFVFEKRNLRKASREALPHSKNYPEIDSFYDLYRLGVGMAGEPDHPGFVRGPIGNNPSVIMYSSGEEEIVAKAEKVMGIKGVNLSGKGQSQEIDTINKLCPVSQWNKS